MLLLPLLQPSDWHLSQHFISWSLPWERSLWGLEAEGGIHVWDGEGDEWDKHTSCLAFWEVQNALIPSLPADRDAFWVHDSSELNDFVSLASSGAGTDDLMSGRAQGTLSFASWMSKFTLCVFWDLIFSAAPYWAPPFNKNDVQSLLCAIFKGIPSWGKGLEQ